MITRLDTGGRFAQAVRHGDCVYVAGQVADDRHADITAQCHQVFARIDGLLQRAGSHKSQLLQMQVWLQDMKDYAAFNAVYDAWVDQGAKPARATVTAALIAPEYLVEVMVTAAVAAQGAA